MKKPPFDGMAISESLYSFDGLETDLKIGKSRDIINPVHPRPSLIPAAEYPITDAEERLLDLAWQHAIRTEVHRG